MAKKHNKNVKKHNNKYYVQKRKKRREKKKNTKKVIQQPIIINKTKVKNLTIYDNIKNIVNKHRTKVACFTTIASILISSLPISGCSLLRNMEKSNSINNETVLDGYTGINDYTNSIVKENLNDISFKESEVSVVEASYIEKIDETLEYDSLIEEYSKYFNMNSELVIDAARFITNDYSENMEIFNNNSKESFAIDFVYKLYNGNLNNYGYNGYSFIDNYDMSFIHYEDGKLMLDNGYTYNDYVGYISDILGNDKSLVLAISDYETGYQQSSQALNKNNFGGIRNKNGYMTFPTPEAGIIYLNMTVKKLLNYSGVYDINSLSGIYVNGNPLNPSLNWADKVTSIQNDININPDNYFTKKLTY